MHEIFDAGKSAGIAGAILSGVSIGLGAVGTVIATLTAEGLSSLVVAGGGVAVVVYGVYCSGRDKRTRTAERERDEALQAMADVRVELFDLRAWKRRCEKNHGPFPKADGSQGNPLPQANGPQGIAPTVPQPEGSG